MTSAGAGLPIEGNRLCKGSPREDRDEGEIFSKEDL